MKNYTGKGDRGATGFLTGSMLSKADERIGAIGDIEELIAQFSVLRTAYPKEQWLADLFEGIQADLHVIADALTVNDIARHVLSDAKIAEAERLIDQWNDGNAKEAQTPLAAQLLLLCAVARRAERSVIGAGKRIQLHPNAMKYMNRLSDLLAAAAVHADAQTATAVQSGSQAGGMQTDLPQRKAVPGVGTVGTKDTDTAEIVEAVLARLGGAGVLTLAKAKKLIERIEAYAAEQGKSAVIAVCNAQGNPIAVHVMDGAFLVSFDVAMKKAYTAVAVKMSTMELSALVQPGGTFYGLQNMDQLITFGGGVPLRVGQVIVGGLGVSGGTGEEDHALCAYGLSVFSEMMG